MDQEIRDLRKQYFDSEKRMKEAEQKFYAASRRFASKYGYQPTLYGNTD
jgi:hypothetical protein